MFSITGTRFCKAGFHNVFFSFIVICFSYYMSKETNICENLEHDIVAR